MICYAYSLVRQANPRCDTITTALLSIYVLAVPELPSTGHRTLPFSQALLTSFHWACKTCLALSAPLITFPQARASADSSRPLTHCQHPTAFFHNFRYQCNPPRRPQTAITTRTARLLTGAGQNQSRRRPALRETGSIKHTGFLSSKRDRTRSTLLTRRLLSTAPAPDTFTHQTRCL